MAEKVFAYLITLASLVLLAEGKGLCYMFTGDGRVTFDLPPTYNPQSAHYRLKFATKSNKGVIYYGDGGYHPQRVYDFEGLFLSEGYLHYFLFNPTQFGVGSTFGFYGRSVAQLNDGNWHTVEFFRNREAEITDADGNIRTVIQTGLIVDGEEQNVDNQAREGIRILSPVILGEDPHLEERASSTVGPFRGKIKDFENMETNAMMTDGRLTGASHCVVGETGSV